MKKYNKIMEYFWLAMGVITFVIGVYYVYLLGVTKAYLYLLLPVMPFAMWYMRKSLRIKTEKREGGE